MQTLLRLLARAPLPLLQAIFAGVSWAAFHLFRWRRRLAAANLAFALPELGAAERAAILRQSYRNLGDVLAEAVWGFGAPGESLGERVHFENPEVLVDAVRAGRPVVLLTAHFCNWEWLLPAAGAVLGIPIDAVYKPLRDRGVDAFIRAARSRFGGNPIPHKRFIAEVMRQRNQARVYAMVADQTPLQQDAKHWARFLGRDTPFFAGAGKIARLLRAPVLYVAMHRVARGRYRVRLVPLAAPPYDSGADARVIDGYARMLERAIRESPADWFWVHRKWKYPRPPAG